MLLRRVELKNFRALAEIAIDLDETTVLIGENNTGKTSFLEAIKVALTQAANRRGDALDDYDHHLSSDQAQLGDAGETSIVLHFAEEQVDEWGDDVVQTLSEVVVIVGDRRKVVLRLRSGRDVLLNQMTATWEFLDAAGNAHRPKRPIGVILRELQQLKPFFYLSAVRDAAREFQPRSSFWGPFLRDPKISDEVRTQLEADLNELNAKVIAAEPRLKDVKERLQKASDIVSIRETDAVSIEAVPGRARDLLSRAQVSVAGRTGARLPMVRHGAGTQSLSVLFLFEAFLTSMLESIYGPGSVPVVAIEEPEAHLHPAATRALWAAISAMPGQKIIATHSGDLLARVPLRNIRRFCHSGNGVVVRRLETKTLSADDERKITLHLKATRGELLFARAWLLVEGATEVWLFEGLAEILGLDLERSGVRIVQYAQVMPGPFVRVADDLGIAWFCVADGDQGAQKYKKDVEGQLGKRPPKDHLLVFTEPDVEVHLCGAGFGSVYEASVAEQKRKNITTKPGDAQYWEQVVAAAPHRGKEARAIKVLDEIRAKGQDSVPPILKQILLAVEQLAGGSRGS